MVGNKIEEGNQIGKWISIPITDTSVYEVEFSAVSCKEYMANLLIENSTNNCHEEIKNKQIFSSILDHSKDSSTLSKKNAFIQTESKKQKDWEL